MQVLHHPLLAAYLLLAKNSQTDFLSVKNRGFSLSGVIAGSKQPFLTSIQDDPQVVFIGFMVSHPNVDVSTMKSKQFSVANPMLILPRLPHNLGLS